MRKNKQKHFHPMNLFFICIDTGFIPKASTGQLLLYLYSDVTGIILVIRYCFSSGIPVLVQYSTNTGNQCRFNRGIPVLGQYWFYSFCIVQVKYRHTFTVLIQALYHLPHCRYYRYMPVLKQYCNSTGMFTGLVTTWAVSDKRQCFSIIYNFSIPYVFFKY